jgi:hypothetical protein
MGHVPCETVVSQYKFRKTMKFAVTITILIVCILSTIVLLGWYQSKRDTDEFLSNSFGVDSKHYEYVRREFRFKKWRVPAIMIVYMPDYMKIETRLYWKFNPWGKVSDSM